MGPAVVAALWEKIPQVTGRNRKINIVAAASLEAM
jgi:hypothetical protein